MFRCWPYEINEAWHLLHKVIKRVDAALELQLLAGDIAQRGCPGLMCNALSDLVHARFSLVIRVALDGMMGTRACGCAVDDGE